MTTARLADKVAMITGSDSGIGQGSAIEMAKEGAKIVVHYLDDEKSAQETVSQVEEAGSKAFVVQGDVSIERDVERMFDDAISGFGSIDILMNNAGVDASGTPVCEMSTEQWDRAIHTNLYGAFFGCRRFIQHRKEHGGGGKIINVTSVHDEIPHAGGAEYCVTKGAIQSLTRTLALELAADGICVNNLGPGMVLTPVNQAAIDDPKLLNEQVQSIPLKRAAEPWEVGRMAVYLASSDADYVTGSTFYIDGGLMQNQGQGA